MRRGDERGIVTKSNWGNVYNDESRRTGRSDDLKREGRGWSKSVVGESGSEV